MGTIDITDATRPRRTGSLRLWPGVAGRDGTVADAGMTPMRLSVNGPGSG